jgi:plastocyanin
MQQTRRNWLRTAGGVLAGVALAGCSDSSDDDSEEPATDNSDDSEQSNGEEEDPQQPETEFEAVDIGVASEWNAMRTRLRDPVILGHAGEYAAGASVAQDIFQQFETKTGEHNAHEALEETNEANYEGFEGGLADLRSRLNEEDLEGAHEAMRTADQHLKEAQIARTSEEAATTLTLLVMGAHVEDAALLVELEDFEDAAMEFSQIATKFEEKLYDAVSEADSAAADAVVDSLETAATAAEESDAEGAIEAANEAFNAATTGAHALASDELAGAAQMAALQARGWDGTTVARAGGPSQSYAHAAALNEYRARARDAVWLFQEDRPEAATALVQGGLQRFETARAHDALEEADKEAYESFEGGLESLVGAIEAEDSEGVSNGLQTVDEALRSGIAALVTGEQHALLEAGYAKIRVEDAVEQYRLGRQDRAVTRLESLFADFEADKGGFHETLEETDEALYEAYEHEHLEGLIEAIKQGNDEAVSTHIQGIRETLLTFETALAGVPAVSGVESGYLTARALDAVVLAALGEEERASAILGDALGYFESGAGGFHEALEEADHEIYAGFEGEIESLAEEVGGESTISADTVADRATAAIYAVVSAGGGGGASAASLVQSVFAHFEEAVIHDPLEEADGEAYESFESTLESYIQALESGSGASEGATRFADAALRGQFALAGAPDQAPVDAEPSDGEENPEPDLEGGPNVVEGVPADADHVVDMQAVAFDPQELTIKRGDTVAWRFAAGEPHSVTAYEDELPDGATYWASGDFDSEQAAREGWENGQGAIQKGESYVRTFETSGEHGYVCIPHETAGMTGTVVVEESE